MSAALQANLGDAGAPELGPLSPHVGPLSPDLGPLSPHVGSLSPDGEGTAARSPSMPSAPRSASLVEQLVRDPKGFLVRIEGRDVPALVRELLAVVAIGGSIFGAVVGSSRGGRQVIFGAVKLPLLLIGTLVLCAPAFMAVARATGAAISPRAVIALTLGASARFALVLAGLAPVVWLVQGMLGYHGLILMIVTVCAVSGCAAGGLLFRGLFAAQGAGAGERSTRAFERARESPAAAWAGPLAGLAFVAIYAVVGAQSAWLLRPFVVRPRTVDVPFVRSLEGDLLDSVATSVRSSAGIYDPLTADVLSEPPTGARGRHAPRTPPDNAEPALSPGSDVSEDQPRRAPRPCEELPCD